MEGLSVHLERLLEAARSAPSHDNSQPWRFSVSGERISFGVDSTRDPSPDGTMARIAIGASLECACVAAARMGATVRFVERQPGALVTVSITSPKRLAEPDLSRTRRVTNRRPYDGRAFDDATAQALKEATKPRDRAQTHWFGRERVRALGPLFEQADELFFLDADLRERALSAIRFDVKDREEVARGLSVGSLEPTAADRASLVRLADFRAANRPVDPQIAAVEFKKMGGRARRLVESASGVCIITTAGDDEMGDVHVGRAVQRAWMALTHRGLAAQPMTTMLSLARSSLAADPELGPRVMAVLTAFRRAFPSVGKDARIAFLMRFGWAEAPSCRVGRLPLEDSLGVQ